MTTPAAAGDGHDHRGDMQIICVTGDDKGRVWMWGMSRGSTRQPVVWTKGRRIWRATWGGPPGPGPDHIARDER